MSRSENGTIASAAGNNQGNDQQRLCHIVKRDDFDGYGFNLHSEKGKPGQYIGKVDENSPAEKAGLRQGDRIIEVNGVNIGNETHKQVVQRIKAIANEVRLLVIDPNQEKKNSINGTTNATVTSSTTTTITATSTTVGASTLSSIDGENVDDDVNQKKIINNNNSPIKIDDKNDNMSGSTSPSVSVKSETNSASCSSNLNNNNINKMFDKTDSKDINDLDIPAAIASVTAAVAAAVSASTIPSTPPQQSAVTHQNGTTTVSSTVTLSNINNSNGSSPTKPSGLNLPMTAAEMRAKLLAKKKYDPKNDTVDLRKKFDIIQKL